MTKTKWIKLGISALSIVLLVLGSSILGPISGWYTTLFIVGMISSFCTGRITKKPVIIHNKQIVYDINDCKKNTVLTTTICEPPMQPSESKKPVSTPQPKKPHYTPKLKRVNEKGKEVTPNKPKSK